MGGKFTKGGIIAAAVACMLCAGAMGEQKATESLPVAAITKASVDVTMSFVRPGRVTDINVKVGDAVSKGMQVAKQDDTEEQAAYNLAEAEAKDQTRLEAQYKIRDQKEKVYERK